MDSKFQLVVQASSDPGLIRVEAHGRLSEHTVEKLVRVLARAAMLDGCTLIRVDLSKVVHASARACEMLGAHIRAHGHRPLITVDVSGLDPSLASLLGGKQLPVRYLGSDSQAEIISTFVHPLEVRAVV